MNTITFATACEKYGLEKKKLVGHCLRNDLDDPLVIERTDDGEYLLLDDWRLKKLADAHSTNKSNEQQS